MVFPLQCAQYAHAHAHLASVYFQTHPSSMHKVERIKNSELLEFIIIINQQSLLLL